MKRATCKEMHRTENGFSLIELMLTIVIFSILATALVPGVSSLLARQDAKGASEQVRALFQFARTQAAVDNIAHQVVILPAQGPSGGVLRVYQGASSSCTFDITSSLVREVELTSVVGGSAVSIDGSEAGRIEIPTRTRLVEVLPDDILEAGICFRPDGSVRDAVTNLPIIAQAGTDYGAGDVVLVLQDHIVRSEGNITPRGTPLRVLLPYSGIARVTY